MSTRLYVLSCTALVVAFSIGFILAFNKNLVSEQATLAQDVPAIVRLHSTETGAFFCSGTVISDTQVLTAAHCVMLDTPLGLLVKDTVDVRKAPGSETGVTAKVLAGRPSSDYAILYGDFKNFHKMKPTFQTADIIQAVKSHKLIVCGYPAGGALVCEPLTHARFSNFKIMGSSFLYPGMSGGPCIDMLTNTIIGVNFGVDGEDSFINPINEIFTSLKVTQ